MTDREKLIALVRELEQLRAQLPAHSIPPSVLIRIDELEDEIELLRESQEWHQAD
jgi:hypothetical protein